MKAGTAAIIKALLMYGPTTKQKIAALFYVGEEYDFCGMKKFAPTCPSSIRMIINPEPTDLKILRGCRGVTEFSFSLRGKSAHAANQSQGVNAIDAIMAIKEKFSDLGSVNLAYLRGGTLTDKQITVRPNLIPDFGEATIEVRTGGELSETEIKNRILSALEPRGVKLERFDCPINLPPGKSADGTLLPGFENFAIGNPQTNGYFDTALLTEKRSCEMIVCGSGPAKMAHQADEYVDLRDLEKLDEALKNLFRADTRIGPYA